MSFAPPQGFGAGKPTVPIISTGNQTTAPLGSAETYTGTWERVQGDGVVVSCKTDNGGTLFFDFSNDATNADTFPPSGFTIASGIHEFHTAKVNGRYFRVRLVNDSGAQTFLRLYTYFGPHTHGNAPVGSGVNADSDGMTVKGVLFGKTPSDVYTEILSDEAGGLLTADLAAEIALGNIPGRIIGDKFGRNPDVDSGSTPEDIWNGGGNYTGHPFSTPETVDVSSADANDTSAGTGARSIRIYGLKTSTSTAEETEDVTMNGTSNVTSSSTWYRIYRAHCLTYGSGGTNAGDITIHHTTTTANVFAVVPAGQCQTTIAAFTVPQGKTMLIKSAHISIARANAGTGSAEMSLRVRPNTQQGAETGTGGYRAIQYFDLTTQQSIDLQFYGGIVVIQNMDVKWRCEDVSANDTKVNASWEYELV